MGAAVVIYEAFVLFIPNSEFKLSHIFNQYRTISKKRELFLVLSLDQTSPRLYRKGRYIHERYLEVLLF